MNKTITISINNLVNVVKNISKELNISQLLIRKNIQEKTRLRKMKFQVSLEKRKLTQITKLVEHNKELYQGLKKLEKIKNLPAKIAETKALEIYQNEIKRLEGIIEEYGSRQKNYTSKNSLIGLQKPELVWSLNPLKLNENIKLFQIENYEYKDKIRKEKNSAVDFSFEKDTFRLKMSSDNTAQYKPENLTTHATNITTDDKLISTYYLIDIPRFLTDEVLFKLATSHLSFTISIFIEPTNSHELIKKARQRAAVLKAQQEERVGKGKLSDQQTEKSIEETTQFIYELVHEYEKGFLFSFLSIS
jgi:hypothetical protein